MSKSTNADDSQGLSLELDSSKQISIEFFYSTSANFEFAVEVARKFRSFEQVGRGKDAIYRVSIGTREMGLALELVDYLKGWRRRAVYVDDEKVPWDSVFEFLGCYKKRLSSYNPSLYCFGQEAVTAWNIWGCMQAEMPFHPNAEWFTWGRWIGADGEWEFDKSRIRHELERNLRPYRFCPSIQLDLIRRVLRVFPERVNPNKDENWVFVESGDLQRSGFELKGNDTGNKKKRVAIGVAPRGPEVLETITSRLDGEHNTNPATGS